MTGRQATGDGQPDEMRDDATEAAAEGESPVAGRPSPAVSRRRALKVLGVMPFAGAAMLQQGTQQQTKPKQTHESPSQPAADTKLPPPSQPKAKFFTPREVRTLRRLADDIIPRDERSGSATEAGVVEYIDFHLSVEETDVNTRTAWRGGLRWLDTESKKRFGTGYAAAAPAQRHAILDDIADPAQPKPGLSYGIAFFNRARDMVGAGFFSSMMGFQDLKYIGNVFNPEWTGCPEPALRKLGVSYDLMTSRVTPQNE